ncbi:MAG TPA: outer membrane beta-barrel protein, partial [Bacteroidales bacterium]|nr:outer membrane beta-barrel protein [Bacteroidales bacterium]
MKKIPLTIYLLCLFSASQAQLYIHLNSGYSVSTHPSIMQNRVITDNTIEQFRIKFSYGNGLNLGIGAGYAFSEHFFAELNAVTTFFSRSRSENNWEYYFKREYYKLHLTGLNGDVLIRNSSIQLAPMIGYSINAGKFSPFFKAGLNILYLKSRYANTYTYKYFDSGIGWYLETTEVKRRSDGGMQLGFRGSAGILYRLSEKLMFM